MEPQLLVADVDLDRLRQERSRMMSLRDQVGDFADRARAMRRVGFALGTPDQTDDLRRDIARFPFVPTGAADRDDRCREVLAIQSQGLVQRLRSTGIDKIVLGVSGGLDSTLALLVAIQAFDAMGLPRTNIHAYTMPGFATGGATLARSHVLMDSLGVTGNELDIRPSCLQMLADLDHPFAKGEPVYDVTFENVQAGERTSHLFRLANHLGGIVLGLALLGGWRYWQSYTTQRAEEAAAVFAEYQAAGSNTEAAQAAFERLVSEHKRSPYTLQARLLEAKSSVEAEEFDEAAEQLRAVVRDSKDDELAHVARLRLARVLIQQGKHEEAVDLLKPEKAEKPDAAPAEEKSKA